MSAYTATGEHVSLGMSDTNRFFTEHVLEQALANLDTLAITMPSGLDKGVVPLVVDCWNGATPRVRQTNYAITSYNATTGVLTLTASGAVADGSTFTILWVVSTVG